MVDWNNDGHIGVDDLILTDVILEDEDNNVGGGDNVTDENAPFYHEPHIKRSDSVVPGYCVDVTKVDLSNNSKDYYVDNFARVDFDCGYAWNYDWSADQKSP